MGNRYDYAEFKAYSAETGRMEVVCRVSLIRGSLVFSGPDAQDIRHMVEENDYLAEERKVGGYTLLAAMPFVFRGSYFFCTRLQHAHL